MGFWEYGGYLFPGEKSLNCPSFPAQDSYTKRTNIWGTAIKPVPRPVPAPKPFAGQPRNVGGKLQEGPTGKRSYVASSAVVVATKKGISPEEKQN
jgi:hypothetical protein